MKRREQRDRNARPVRVDEVLGRVLEERGFASRLEQARVVQQWPALVGEHIAAVTRAEVISEKGVLIVSVKTHAWMSELSLLEREILATINRATPQNPIQKIHWQLMR
ncbi:MAG: DciA family protein [Gemmatimonadaceae bacterium]